MAVWSSGLRKLLVSKLASRSQRQRAISNVDLTKACHQSASLERPRAPLSWKAASSTRKEPSSSCLPPIPPNHDSRSTIPPCTRARLAGDLVVVRGWSDDDGGR